jgi:hypothetical protein
MSGDVMCLCVPSNIVRPHRMEAVHALAQHEFNAGRFQTSFLYADHLLPPTAFVSGTSPTATSLGPVLQLHAELRGARLHRLQRYFYDRALRYLYEYEGARLLGFAADRTGHWARCVSALSAVLAGNPGDTFARTCRDHCQEKLDVDLRAAQQQQLQQKQEQEQQLQQQQVVGSEAGRQVCSLSFESARVWGSSFYPL